MNIINTDNVLESSALLQLVCNTRQIDMSISYIYNISNIKGDRYKNRSTSTFTLEPKIECNKIQKFSLKKNTGSILGKIYLKITIDNDNKNEKDNENEKEINVYDCIDEIELKLDETILEKHTGELLYVLKQLNDTNEILHEDNNTYYIPLEFSMFKEIDLSVFFYNISINIKFKNSNIKSCLLVDYIYLDSEESRNFKNQLHKGIGIYIDQYELEKEFEYKHTNEIKEDEEFITIDVPKVLCKELIWTVSNPNVIQHSSICFNDKYYKTFQQSNFIYNKLLPKKWYNSSPSNGIFMYPFYTNEKKQGYINLKSLNKACIKMKLKTTTESIKIKLYTRKYKVYTLINGTISEMY